MKPIIKRTIKTLLTVACGIFSLTVFFAVLFSSTGRAADPSVLEIAPSEGLTFQDIKNFPGSGSQVLAKPDNDAESRILYPLTLYYHNDSWAAVGFDYSQPHQRCTFGGNCSVYHIFASFESFDEMVVGLSLIQGEPRRVKFELTDAEGNRSFVYLNGLEQPGDYVYRIPMDYFVNQGVRLEQIKAVMVVVEKPADPAGRPFTGVLKVYNDHGVGSVFYPDSQYGSRDVTYLPGNPSFYSVASEGSCNFGVCKAQYGISFTFDTDWSHANLLNVLNLKHLIFGVKSNGAIVKFKLTDINGSAEFYLAGIKPDKTVFFDFLPELLKRNPPIDLTQIRELLFIMDVHTIGEPFIEVESKGSYANSIMTIAPNNSLTPQDLIPLPGYPQVMTVGTEGTVRQTPRGFAFNYDFNSAAQPPHSYHLFGGGFTFDEFQTPGVTETADLSGFKDQIPFGVKAVVNGDPASVNPVFEIKDVHGNSARGRLLSVGEYQAEMVYAIPVENLVNLDLTKVTQIYFMMEQDNSSYPGAQNVSSGTVEINHFPDLQFPIPPDRTASPADLIQLPPGAVPTAVGHASARLFTRYGSIVYYQTAEDGWAGGGFSFDQYATPQIETADLSKYEMFRFGIVSTAPNLKVEMVDSKGRKAAVHISGVSSEEERVFTFPKNIFGSVELEKVRFIYFIVEGKGLSGAIQVFDRPVPIVVSMKSRSLQGSTYRYLPLSFNRPTIEPRLFENGDPTFVIKMNRPLDMWHPNPMGTYNGKLLEMDYSWGGEDGKDVNIWVRFPLKKNVSGCLKLWLLDHMSDPLPGNSSVCVQTLYGDVNQDGVVNLLDLALVLRQVYKRLNDSNFLCDINTDGKIDLKDLVDVKNNFGKKALACGR